MITLEELKSRCPQKGKIAWMGIRPERKGPLQASESLFLSLDDAIQGDHYSRKSGKRQVTLIQGEHIDAVGRILNKKVDPTSLRRNIVVTGINLISLKDRAFKIGDEVVLKGTGYCHPCSRMEENLGEGGYNAMRGHGGITATILKEGRINIGDEVIMMP